MKSRLITKSFILLLLVSSFIAQAQFDDLYYDYTKDKEVVSTSSTNTPSTNYTDEEEYVEEGAYDDEAFDEYDEYSYSTRIRRFQRPVVQNVYYNNFDSWWGNGYNDPYYSNNGGVNVFIGNGWNSWNRPWGWNSWNNGWGWNSWNNPYAFNNGWGNNWNSWNNCGNYGWGNGWNSWGNNGWGNNGWGNNYYYGNVYYGNGWNGNNWNNNSNDYNNKVYGSRKGGSLTSSTKGRDASPRRIATGGNGTQVDKVATEAATETSTRSKRDDRSYRGDIKQADVKISPDNSRRADRSRIYTNPDKNATNTPERDARRSGTEPKRTESRRTEGTNTRSYERPSSNGGSYDNGSNRPSSSRSTFDSGSSRSSSSGSNMGSSRSSSGSSGGSSSGSSRSGGGGSRRGGGK